MTPVREAATLMLVDDRPDLHVFMLRRNPRSVFGPGASVFPGGAIDPADSAIAASDQVVGLDDAGASARLGVASGGLRVWVAALRETFEEAGILLAAEPSDGSTAADLAESRLGLNAGAHDLSAVLATHGVTLDAGDIHLFSHWLTPEGAPRRYDTWFLIAPAPAGQEGSPDDGELVHSEWIRPADAIASHERGDSELIFPTYRTLRILEQFETAAALLAAVRDANAAADRAPLVVPDASGQRIALTDDDRAVATRGWRALRSQPLLDLAAMDADFQPGPASVAARRGVA
jgi:8-oxo-dGTP pyrophosphatase MutT (NUDIX family)